MGHGTWKNSKLVPLSIYQAVGGGLVRNPHAGLIDFAPQQISRYSLVRTGRESIDGT